MIIGVKFATPTNANAVACCVCCHAQMVSPKPVIEVLSSDGSCTAQMMKNVRIPVAIFALCGATCYKRGSTTPVWP